MAEFHPEKLRNECRFKAVRSSGKGGQHVNKVSTAVELYFDVLNSSQLSSEQKKTISIKLKNRINKYGELIIVSQSERSQLANKKKVVERFNYLIQKSLQKKKPRVATKISAATKRQRLEEKLRRGEKKALRKKDWL